MRLALVLVLVVLVVVFLHSGVCQRKDQTYIIVRPEILMLAQNKQSGTVQVICRQLPLPANFRGTRIKVSRSPKTASSGSSSQDLAELTSNDPNCTLKVSSTFYRCSGDVNRELRFTMTAAVCGDADYQYTCEVEASRTSAGTRQSNAASATFSVDTKEPSISIHALPTMQIYKPHARVTLKCSTGSEVVGIAGKGEATWVWEYNDVGEWKPAPKRTVQAGLIKRDPRARCFLTSTKHSALIVSVQSISLCSRRFRCSIKRPGQEDVDNAKEFLISKGFDCNGGFKVLGTDPLVAIVAVLGVVAFFCLLAYGLFVLSSNIRRTKKERREKQIELRILTPMTAAQRDRLLKEKWKELEKPKVTPDEVPIHGRVDREGLQAKNVRIQAGLQPATLRTAAKRSNHSTTGPLKNHHRPPQKDKTLP